MTCSSTRMTGARSTSDAADSTAHVSRRCAGPQPADAVIHRQEQGGLTDGNRSAIQACRIPIVRWRASGCGSNGTSTRAIVTSGGTLRSIESHRSADARRGRVDAASAARAGVDGGRIREGRDVCAAQLVRGVDSIPHVMVPGVFLRNDLGPHPVDDRRRLATQTPKISTGQCHARYDGTPAL